MRGFAWPPINAGEHGFAVGRSPWTAADALVGPRLSALVEPDQGSGAGEGARPTIIHK
jgi:hypothetical protein